MLLDILLPCPRLVSRPFCPTRLHGINSSPSTHPPPCASSQFGAPLFESQLCCPNLKPLAPLLFSCTYELQILQPLSFHNHTKCRGCVAHSHSLLPALSPRVRHVPLVCHSPPPPILSILLLRDSIGTGSSRGG